MAVWLILNQIWKSKMEIPAETPGCPPVLVAVKRGSSSEGPHKELHADEEGRNE
jgi:hypothetical protein